MTAFDYVLIWLGAMSIVAFAAMGADKHKARTHRHRIPETTLISLAVLGGGLGGFLGMVIFRHKTRKVAFALGFPIILLAQLALLWLLTRYI